LNLASLHLWIPPSVLWTFGAIVALLVVATIVVALMRRGDAGSHVELAARVNSWWVLVGVFAVALLFRRGIAIGFFAMLSFLALKEYLSLIPTRRADRRVLFWAYLCVPIQYWWVWQQWYHMFLIFIPVWAFLFIAMRMVLRGETKDFLRAAGTIHWGLMTMVFGLSHLAYLLVLPDGAPARGAHGAALLLFVVLLTELNDVLQYIWGRTLGRRKVMESVSPKKTVEGLVGGALTTTLVAFLLAPVLTPLTRTDSIAVGLMIGFGGFLGDVTISAVKRDIGVKDTGTMIPGHGGILDRIDSLLFTAPLFFHFMAFFYF
jgi:phosphatidate cytidylyltransferase